MANTTTKPDRQPPKRAIPVDRARFNAGVAALDRCLTDCTGSHTADDIVRSLCGFVWVREHMTTDPMPDSVGLSAREFRDLLPHVRERLRDDLALRIGTLYGEAGLGKPPAHVVDRCFEPRTLEKLHSTWLNHRIWPEEATYDRWVVRGHPVYAVVAAAMKLKIRAADIDRNRSGIQPSFLSAPAAPGNIVPLKIRMDSATLDSCGFRSQPGYAWIPDVPEGVDGPTPAVMLALLDANPDGPQHGSRVPIRDRLFVEAMMAAVPTQRTGSRLVDIPVREIVHTWLRWTYYRPSNPDTGEALSRALKSLNHIHVPMNNHGGWWKPIHVAECEGLRLNDRVHIEIHLPFDSDRGARVDRHAMRVAGKISLVAWRLYLSLCYEWNRIAWRGKVPHLTRPEVRRDDAGYVLGADGSVLTSRRGTPSESPYDKRAVRTGRREPNPRGERLHRRYKSAADLVGLIWPLGAPAMQCNRSLYERRAVEATRWLAREIEPRRGPVRLRGAVLDEPAVRIVREGRTTKKNTNGFPWRIVRPETR